MSSCWSQLWIQQLNHFSVHLTGHLSSLYPISLSRRMLWATVSKALLKLRSTTSPYSPSFSSQAAKPVPLLCIFPSLPSAHTSAEAPLDLHIFHQIQLQASDGSPDPNRACSDSVFILLPGHLSLLPSLIHFLCISFLGANCSSMQASCHSWSTSGMSGWTIPELRDSNPWKKSTSFPGPLFSSS